MKQNKLHEPRKKLIFPIEFPTLVEEETTSQAASSSYTLLDLGEEAIFDYQGVTINLALQALIEIKILGSGNFGDVMLTEIRGHPEIKMAVKVMSSRHNPSDFTANTDLRTIRTVGSGVNPHVTKYYAALLDRSNAQLLICMEACETSIDKFYFTMHTIEKTQHIDLLLKRIIHHIADALLFLKTQRILHRDVKPSNILIIQNPITFKLCDFGICGELIDSATRTMTKGTRIYLAPERIDAKLSPHGYGIRSDMWALGLSIIEIALNQHPFNSMNETAILNKVETWTPELPSTLSAELQQLIIWLLLADIYLINSMAPFTFTLFAPYNKQAALLLKNASVRMFGVDILMEKDESDGYFRATVDVADGIFHYQFKVQTKSWFEKEPEPALPDYDDDEFKEL
ncbi:unnamed protein product, partial [Rotaria socialis]